MRDANGQALAYVYSRETEAEARQAKVLTSDEARRIAINIARLHELLGKGEAAGLSGAAMTTKGPHRSGAKSREPIVMRANARSLMVTSERFTKGLDEIRILLRGDGDRNQSRSASRGCPSC